MNKLYRVKVTILEDRLVTYYRDFKGSSERWVRYKMYNRYKTAYNSVWVEILYIIEENNE